MKCQQCNKTATFHITELTKGKPQELHLCEEHARQYLTQSEEEPTVAPSLAGVLAHQLAVGQTAEELAKLDQRACPVCGITFYEFRNQGRLGCPYDYVCFQAELEPLIVNIHGETEHVGKKSERFPEGTEGRTQLIRLRREMKEAIDEEDYELASKLRDDIRRIEDPAAGPPSGSETKPPSGSETKPPSGSETKPPSGSETKPPSGSETKPPSGGEAGPPSGGES